MLEQPGELLVGEWPVAVGGMAMALELDRDDLMGDSERANGSPMSSTVM
jgi:hypothetical protein